MRPPESKMTFTGTFFKLDLATRSTYIIEGSASCFMRVDAFWEFFPPPHLSHVHGRFKRSRRIYLDPFALFEIPKTRKLIHCQDIFDRIQAEIAVRENFQDHKSIIEAGVLRLQLEKQFSSSAIALILNFDEEDHPELKENPLL